MNMLRRIPIIIPPASHMISCQTIFQVYPGLINISYISLPIPITTAGIIDQNHIKEKQTIVIRTETNACSSPSAAIQFIKFFIVQI